MGNVSMLLNPLYSDMTYNSQTAAYSENRRRRAGLICFWIPAEVCREANILLLCTVFMYCYYVVSKLTGRLFL